MGVSQSVRDYTYKCPVSCLLALFPKEFSELAPRTRTVHPIKGQHLHVPFGLGVECMSSKHAISAIKLVHFKFKFLITQVTVESSFLPKDYNFSSELKLFLITSTLPVLVYSHLHKSNYCSVFICVLQIFKNTHLHKSTWVFIKNEAFKNASC